MKNKENLKIFEQFLYNLLKCIKLFKTLST